MAQCWGGHSGPPPLQLAVAVQAVGSQTLVQSGILAKIQSKASDRSVPHSRRGLDLLQRCVMF